MLTVNVKAVRPLAVRVLLDTHAFDRYGVRRLW